ncbi:MAG: cupin domain-containing protein [Chloroflexota bacterium]|nr:cupin domain-containing protein [Chloroflexota bacterium]
MRASTGVLSKGSEYGTHRDADEIAYIIRGRGYAIVGTDTVAIEPGVVTFIPQGMPHGFINESEEPLEYLVVHSPQSSATGFRRRAALPGPYCSRGSR